MTFQFIRRSVVLIVATLGAATIAVKASAQIPPHPPGTVCLTQTFWCWAQPPGPPGTQCWCMTAQGRVAGFRG